MKIHYIAQYVDPELCGDKEYEFSPGGSSKMRYFLSVLKDLGFKVSIFSLSPRKKGFITFPRKRKNCFNQSLSFASTLNIPFKYRGLIRNLWFQIQLFLFLLFINKIDIVYFYHERFYMPVIKLMKKIRKIKFICDVEEIYTVHAGYSQKIIDKEIDYLKSFDRHTVATENLAKILKLKPDNYVVCNGVYGPIKKYEPHEKSKIRVIYTGTFDKTKGGVFTSLETFRYLNHKYELIVCGFGNNSQSEEVKELCNKVNAEKGYMQVQYMGFVPGNSIEYENILKSCDIGLAVQNPNGDYNQTSFPSKILEYMRYGLSVVSSDIEVVRESKISNYIIFSSGSPEDIAQKIKSHDFNHTKGIKILPEIESEFKYDLNKLFQN